MTPAITGVLCDKIDHRFTLHYPVTLLPNEFNITAYHNSHHHLQHLGCYPHLHFLLRLSCYPMPSAKTSLRPFQHLSWCPTPLSLHSFAHLGCCPTPLRLTFTHFFSLLSFLCCQPFLQPFVGQTNCVYMFSHFLFNFSAMPISPPCPTRAHFGAQKLASASVVCYSDKGWSTS